jgi:hypothetical protein
VTKRLWVTGVIGRPARRRCLARFVGKMVCAIALIAALSVSSARAAFQFRAIAPKIAAFGSDSERYVAW